MVERGRDKGYGIGRTSIERALKIFVGESKVNGGIDLIMGTMHEGWNEESLTSNRAIEI